MLIKFEFVYLAEGATEWCAKVFLNPQNKPLLDC